MQQSAQKLVRMTDRPPYLGMPTEPSQNQLSVLSRGVEWRTIYAQESLSWTGQMGFIAALEEAGEIARVHDEVPLKVVIVDDTQALMSVMLDDSGVGESALVVQQSSLLDSLIVLFELLWEKAVPISASGSDEQEGGPNALEQNLLRMLIAGMKDEAIARELGVVRRTVQRRFGMLMEKAGARTRMQLVATAVRRGWV
jgi:DNA-binding CsgD family transcriptional regulator